MGGTISNTMGNSERSGEKSDVPMPKNDGPITIKEEL
jgi:hypothetical protein